MVDPLQSMDPWCVRNAKGRIREETAVGPSARTLGDFLPGAGGPKWPLSNIEFGNRNDRIAEEVSWAVEQPGMEAWIAGQPKEAQRVWHRHCRRHAEVLAKEARVPWLGPKTVLPALPDADAKESVPKLCDPNMLKPENPFQFGVYPSPSLIQEAISGPRFFKGPSGGM